MQLEHVMKCLQLLLESFGDGQAHVLAGLTQLDILNETVVHRFLKDVADHLVEALLTDGQEKVVALAEDLAESNVAVEKCVPTKFHYVSMPYGSVTARLTHLPHLISLNMLAFLYIFFTSIFIKQPPSLEKTLLLVSLEMT